jgi:hypothetical protein
MHQGSCAARYANADGTADLVDVVILRRPLAGMPVP